MITLPPETEGIYLLHFDPPYLHARHYLGWAQDIARRIGEHTAGKGSPLVAAAVNAGCVISLVRIWEGGTRTEERKMKQSKAVPRLYCPIC